MPALHPDDRSLLITSLLVMAGALCYGLIAGSVMLPLLVGSLILALSLVVARISQAGTASRIALPALGMAMVGLLIHVAQGRPEAHFAVFAFLAVTVVYRHTLPVVAAAATIAIHHLTFNYFQTWGWGPICFTEPGLMHVIEHALYVIAEAGILIMLAQRARADFRTAEHLVQITDTLLDTSGQIDLRTRGQSPVDQASGTLLEALQGIEHAIVQVRATALHVDTASCEIANGNSELARRTEKTASHLQATTGAMKQLISTVQQTATSARTASELAGTATEVAQRGGQVVAQVIATMDEIDASSKRSPTSSASSTALRSRPISWHSTLPWRPHGRASRGAVSPSSPAKCAIWRSAVPPPPPKSAT